MRCFSVLLLLVALLGGPATFAQSGSTRTFASDKMMGGTYDISTEKFDVYQMSSSIKVSYEPSFKSLRIAYHDDLAKRIKYINLTLRSSKYMSGEFMMEDEEEREWSVLNTIDENGRLTIVSDGIVDGRYKVVYLLSKIVDTKAATRPAAAPVSAASTAAENLLASRRYFPTAKSLADSLNFYLENAAIGFNPNRMFQVVGKIDSDKRSLQFFARNNELYVRISLPEGVCDAGMKEVKALSSGQSGTHGSNGFYVAFKYSLACDGTVFKNIFVNLKRPYSSVFSTMLQARLIDCCF